MTRVAVKDCCSECCSSTLSISEIQPAIKHEYSIGWLVSVTDGAFQAAVTVVCNLYLSSSHVACLLTV